MDAVANAFLALPIRLRAGRLRLAQLAGAVLLAGVPATAAEGPLLNVARLSITRVLASGVANRAPQNDPGQGVACLFDTATYLPPALAAAGPACRWQGEYGQEPWVKLTFASPVDVLSVRMFGRWSERIASGKSPGPIEVRRVDPGEPELRARTERGAARARLPLRVRTETNVLVARRPAQQMRDQPPEDVLAWAEGEVAPPLRDVRELVVPLPMGALHELEVLGRVATGVDRSSVPPGIGPLRVEDVERAARESLRRLLDDRFDRISPLEEWIRVTPDDDGFLALVTIPLPGRESRPLTLELRLDPEGEVLSTRPVP